MQKKERGEENTDEQKRRRRGSEHPARVKCTKEARRHAHARRNPKLRRRRRPSRDRPRPRRRSPPPPSTSWASALRRSRRRSRSVAVNTATAFRISQTNKVQREGERVRRRGFSFACQICAGFPDSPSPPRQQSSARAGAAYAAAYGDSRSLQSERITEKRLSCLRKISHGHRRPATGCKIR